ncbi:alpha/beta hydrolase [Streptomyces sp. SID14478]|uniref:alpha/beta hydrolase n=1 Tax=Streptomyces sp. SID14478 TaxID=2706073 RepID=UPI0013DA8D4D|nr:alpha/beta hydrolase [Streptomyces sp. SID14478]NEB73679.1 alpha/beta hydrolase [Streptomyces sp. SID14478]
MSDQYADHFAPEGLRTRATVVVVPGRGETRATYDRLGKRLAADAYRVRVVEATDLDEDRPDASSGQLRARLAAAVEGAATDGDPVRPVVLVGSDTGAVALAALFARPTEDHRLRPDAVVLAGLPGSGAAQSASWDDELDIRTACPVHRGALTDDPQVRRGALNTSVPPHLLEAALDTSSDIPHLLLVGDRDPLADHDALARLAKSLTSARLTVVHGARHDVLNDQQHRAVAAEIVTFLEALRGDLTPPVTVRSSSW